MGLLDYRDWVGNKAAFWTVCFFFFDGFTCMVYRVVGSCMELNCLTTGSSWVRTRNTLCVNLSWFRFGTTSGKQMSQDQPF